MALFKEMIKRTENIDKTDIDTQAIHRSLKLWSISPLSMNKTGWLEDRFHTGIYFGSTNYKNFHCTVNIIDVKS